MKAWRLEASEINARRKDGSKEPTARVQKVQRGQQRAIKGSTWLLDGLLIRAGIINPLPDVSPRYLRVAGRMGWWNKFVTLTKRLFS